MHKQTKLRLIDAMEAKLVERAARMLCSSNRKDLPDGLAREAQQLDEIDLPYLQALRVAVLGGGTVKVDPHELAPQVNPAIDCPTCPSCSAPCGIPFEKAHWNHRAHANDRIVCPACGSGWVGTDAEVDQAKRAQAAADGER